METKDYLLDLIGCWCVRIVSFCVRNIPLPVALFIGRMSGVVVYLLHKRRRVSYVNLKHSLAHKYTANELRRIVMRTYMNSAQMAVELFCFPKLSRKYFDKNIKVYGFDFLAKALEKKNGVICLTAHFGNWELLGFVSMFLGFPIKALARTQKHVALNDLLNEFRTTHGNEIIGKGFALREILFALKNNEIVGMVGDQSGAQDSVYLELFGRITATPNGAIKLAKRSKAEVVPCFMVRQKGTKHALHILKPIVIPNTGDDEKDIKSGLVQYLALLEKYVSDYPEQWLWGHKRWKHTKNRRLVVLSDGKAGHLSQSKALATMLGDLICSKDMILDTKFCDVKYKSKLHRLLLFVITPIIKPFIQSRMSLLKWFLKQESFSGLEKLPADIVVSCGAGTAPVNIWLTEENSAKNCVIMRPPFPYAVYPYDLMLLLSHDKIVSGKRNVVYLKTALNLADPEKLAMLGDKLKEQFNINKKRCISLFVGGDTNDYFYDSGLSKNSFNMLNKVVQSSNLKIFVTTSRRTRKDIIEEAENVFANNENCPLFVVPTKKNIDNIVYSMMGAGDVLVVAEDSISMISEAVQSGKKVVVLKFSDKKISKKHDKFISNLVKDKSIFLTTAENLFECIDKILQNNIVIDSRGDFKQPILKAIGDLL